MHTGENSDSFEICNKAFSKRGELTRHNRVHTGGKPYSCEICDKVFSKRGDLNVHKRVFTGEKPYECKMWRKKKLLIKTWLNPQI